jgi:nicotinamide phosphoribosyltransferase
MKLSPIAPLFQTDAYKLGMHKFMREGTEYLYSNFTNRGTRIEGMDHVVAFGLQGFIQDYIIDAFEDFFAADEDEVARLYEARVQSILGPNNIGSDHIRELHRKGYLPLVFRSVKEGTMVPLQVPTLTVENTDPKFAFLVSTIESVLSNSIWFTSTNATKNVYMRKFFDDWADRTGADKEFVDWQWHDFSFRGQSSPQSAQFSGAAHLLSFLGTDNLSVFEWIDYLYPGDNGFIGGSVAATEHQVMTARGREGEFETYEHLLNVQPSGILSIVSDTYSLFNVITNFLPRLKDRIMARDGKVVIRPDSGNPEDILLGTIREFGVGVTPEEKGVFELLWEIFGGTVNAKGYRTIDPHIGAIYGDSITYDRAQRIFEGLEKMGFATDNIVFGSGSFFNIGNTTRDTFSSAFKNTHITVDGVGYDVQKDPETGQSKKSALGRLAVTKDAVGELGLIQQATPEQEAASELEVVWADGVWYRKQSFADIRATVKAESKRVLG